MPALRATGVDRGTRGVGQKMVEAVGVEPTSETTDNRELSCFSRVHLCLVSGA